MAYQSVLAVGNYLHLPERIERELTSRNLESCLRLVHSIFIALEQLECAGKKLK